MEGRANIEDPENELSEKLRQLDQDAWSHLFDEHRPKIMRYVFARTGDRETAEDIASQVFVEALESIDRYRYRGKPVLAWLYRIARNHTGKFFRQTKRETPILGPEPSEESVDATLNSLALADALRSLTAEQRDVIALRFFADYSTQEIAAALGKTESAIYSLSIRGINSLRRHLGSEP